MSESIVVPYRYVVAALFAALMLIVIAAEMLVTYWFAAQHDFEVLITVNTYHEFDMEVVTLSILMVLGIAAVVWGLLLVSRAPRTRV